MFQMQDPNANSSSEEDEIDILELEKDGPPPNLNEKVSPSQQKLNTKMPLKIAVHTRTNPFLQT